MTAWLPSGWVSFFLGVTVGVAILWMVRRNQLVVAHSLWWLTISFGSVTIGVFPRWMDWIALKMGVYYPPIFAVVVVLAMLLLKLLTMDLELSRRERQIRGLAQRLAILEEKIHRNRKSDQ